MASYQIAHSRKGTPRPEFQPASRAQKEIFLRHFAETRNVSVACKKAGITRALYRHAMADDPDFREAHEAIDEFFLDKLEDVAFARAHGGDSVLLKFLLQSGRPEKYGNRTKLEVNHRFESVEDIKALSDDDLIATFEEMGLAPPA